jgi:membrane-associated phospholipid phosphatase
MRLVEAIVLVYSSSYGLWAITTRRAERPAYALFVALATVLAALLAPFGPPIVRLLVPGLYLVVGYWLPALVIPDQGVHSSSSFETWLRRTDAVIRPRLPRVPAPLATLSELAYLLCYPIVPIGLGCVWWWGGAGAVPRYWLTVLLAGFACYATLPWLLSRPPDRIELDALTLRHVNRFVLARVSHTWTTFPSGHVAVSWAAALAVLRISPVAGVALAIIATGVSVGAAAGRYHYVVDVLLGVIVAGVAAVIT